MAGQGNFEVTSAAQAEAAAVLAALRPDRGDPHPRANQLAAQMVGHGLVGAELLMPEEPDPVRRAAQLAIQGRG